MQPLFSVCAQFCCNHKITANMVTCAAFFLGLCAALALSLGYALLSLLLLWCSGLLDVVDGSIARLTHASNPFGAFIDLISDRMVECALILSFSFLYPQNSFFYCLFLTSILLHFSTFVLAGALFKNEGEKSMHYDHSLVERAEAFVVFSCMILIPSYQLTVLIIFTGIVFAGGIQRMLKVWNYTQQSSLKL